jgi:hypothetical protein
MEERNPSSHETMRLSTPAGVARLAASAKNRPVSRPKQAGEFSLIFSLYPVEIADLSL